ncbi:MAG: hypothetical protein LBV06_02510 [Propionibacteriaceae bacterium]|jgi:hypothetical protein|nr:hypothetical protein [Propionibacteriaceae bacterium]
MRLLLAELGKIWTWKSVGVVALIIVVVYGAVAWPALSKSSVSEVDPQYGPYQHQMFERYGDTLEPEELADFDIPGKLAQAKADVEAAIAAQPLFGKHGIVTLEDWQEFQESGGALSRLPEPSPESLSTLKEGEWLPEQEQALADDMAMFQSLWVDPSAVARVTGAPGSGVIVGGQVDYGADGIPSAPMWRYSELSNVWRRYGEVDQRIENFFKKGTPVVDERLAAFEDHKSNLIRPDLTIGFGNYMFTIAAMVVVCSLMLIAPVTARDNARGLRALQYSSSSGRRIVGTQLLADCLSSLVLAVVVSVAASVAFMAKTGTGEYWSAHISDIGGFSFWMYDMTFGSYVALICGLVVLFATIMGALGFAVSLASSSMATMMTSAAAVAAGLAIVGIACLTGATSAGNLVFEQVFRSRVPLPELICPAVIAVGAAILVWALTRREARADR